MISSAACNQAPAITAALAAQDVTVAKAATGRGTGAGLQAAVQDAHQPIARQGQHDARCEIPGML